jgi:signal transduction histidine kinase
MFQVGSKRHYGMNCLAFVNVIAVCKTMKKRLLIVVTLLHIITVVFGQSHQHIDFINQKAGEFFNYNADSSIHYAQKAIDMSIESNYAKGKSEGLGKLCFACYMKGEYEKALNYCRESLEIGEKRNANIDLTMTYHALGLIKINQSKYDEAIEIFSHLTELAARQDDLHTMADACGNLGLAYLNKRFFQRAQTYLLTAIKIYGNIEHPHGEVFAHLNYGRLFFEQNEYDSAHYYLAKSAEIGLEIKNERAILHAYLMLGQINVAEYNLDKAEQYFLDAYQLAQSHDLLWEKANISSWLSETYYKKENYSSAISYGETAIQLAKKAKIVYILKKVSTILAKSYLEKNNYDAAESHVKYLEDLIDSLALTDSTDILSSIMDVEDIKREEQSLELVSNQLAVAKAEIGKRNILLIGFVVTMSLLIIILGLIFKSNRTKTKNNLDLKALNEKIQAQKERLEKVNDNLDTINKEKDLLLGMVAHDIRSPLNKISGLVNILKIENGVHQSQQEIYNLVQRTVTDANRLADELLEINKIEGGDIEKKDETLNLSAFFHHLVDLYRTIAKEKDIEVVLVQKCPDIEFSSNRKILQRIFENLMSNAIKFSEQNSTITIEVDRCDKQINFKIIDRGLGIPEEEHSVLFTKFGKTSARPTNGESSNGLGLYIVDHLIKTLGGDLSFKSRPGEGSEFVVAIPMTT